MKLERRWLIMGLALVIVIWMLTLLKGVLMPFVAGALVAYFLDPVADRLEKWGCSRTIATVIITVVIVVALVLGLLIFIPLIQIQVVGFVGKFPGYLDALKAHATPLLQRLEMTLSQEQITQVRDLATSQVGEGVRWIGEMFKQVLSGGVAVFELLSLVVITPLVAFYLLNDWDRIVEKIDGLLPRDMAPTIRMLIAEIDRTLSAFVRGQALVCLILGLFYAVGLALTGLDFGFVIGLGAGLISFVPYLGSILGLLTSVGIAIAQFPSWVDVAIVAAVFFAGQLIEGNFLTPKIVGGSIGLHPVWVIFALLAGGGLFGFTGVMLAVPVAAAIGVLVRYWTQRYRTSALYHGGMPETETESGENSA